MPKMSGLNLKEKYQKEIVPLLVKELGFKNLLAVPKVIKVVVNSGVGEGASDKGAIEEPSQVLASITGQKPKITKARKSEAGFRLRQGAPIGLVVTLRGRRMYDFLERLINLVLPRMRDFQGVSVGSFDKKGNYNLGIPESSVFPETDLLKIKQTVGMQITIVTSTQDDREAKKLLALLGMPFAHVQGKLKQKN